MPVNLGKLPPREMRGYDITEKDNVLSVLLDKTFDTARKTDRWAAMLTEAATGSYQKVVVDLTGFVTISSTVIAGLVHLADHFQANSAEGVILRTPSDRVMRTLEMMQLHTLFGFEQATD